MSCKSCPKIGLSLFTCISWCKNSGLASIVNQALGQAFMSILDAGFSTEYSLVEMDRAKSPLYSRTKTNNPWELYTALLHVPRKTSNHSKYHCCIKGIKYSIFYLSKIYHFWHFLWKKLISMALWKGNA